MTVIRCKYCKGSKYHVNTRQDGRIEKEVCIYCSAKGYIFIQKIDKNLKTNELDTNMNTNNEKEVSKENGVLEKNTTRTESSSGSES